MGQSWVEINYSIVGWIGLHCGTHVLHRYSLVPKPSPVFIFRLGSQ